MCGLGCTRKVEKEAEEDRQKKWRRMKIEGEQERKFDAFGLLLYGPSMFVRMDGKRSPFRRRIRLELCQETDFQIRSSKRRVEMTMMTTKTNVAAATETGEKVEQEGIVGSVLTTCTLKTDRQTDRQDRKSTHGEPFAFYLLRQPKSMSHNSCSCFCLGDQV